jgi:hypothetical protein
MEGSFDRLWKIQKLLEIVYSIFSKVYITFKGQAAENLFFSSNERQFSNNVLLRNTNVLACKHTNCATPLVTLTASKCTWGRTDNAQPIADSSTCHSDINVCGSKGVSSQTAYGEFLLFASTI